MENYCEKLRVVKGVDIEKIRDLIRKLMEEKFSLFWIFETLVIVTLKSLIMKFYFTNLF